MTHSQETAKKILVIENEGIIRLALLDLLHDKGFIATGAENGLIGVKLAREVMPELIVCNVRMPGVSGYEVLRELRTHPITATIPFLFLSAESPQADMIQELQLDTERYLTKPYSSEQLLQAIAKALES
ncbi:response regulator [Microcoleus sp. ZQ-A2]|nr:response regulator [Microcoleus sp. FACHB-1]